MLRSLLVALSLLVVSPALAQRQAEPIVGDPGDPTASFASHPPDGASTAFYRSYAWPEQGKPRTEAGGAWLLETDRRSGLAYPRLTARTDGKDVAPTNRLLEALHGRVIQSALDWHRQAEESMASGDKSNGVDLKTAVTVTYFSRAYFAVREMGYFWSGGHMRPLLVRAVALDLDRGSLVMSDACGRDQRRPFFTFGNLLTICSDARLEAFRALWREQGRLVQATVARQSEQLESCRYSALEYIEEGDISLYLTPAGLAVHNRFRIGDIGEPCFGSADSPFVPVVIPWRKLAPLMNPGPLGDELLALN